MNARVEQSELALRCTGCGKVRALCGLDPHGRDPWDALGQTRLDGFTREHAACGVVSAPLTSYARKTLIHRLRRM